MQNTQKFVLFLLLFVHARGDLIAVKKGDETIACITSKIESAVAFVKKPENDPDFTKVDYSDGKGKSVPLSQYDCNLVLGNCSRWNYGIVDGKGWILLRKNTNSLLRDYRWNDLPTYFVNDTWLETDLEFEMTNRFFLTFSILASEQAEIWISDPKKIFSRKIVIDGNGDRHWTSKQHLIGKFVGDFIGEAQQIEGKPILNGGKKWTHVSIDFRNSPLSLNENEDQLNLGFGSPAYICDGQKCLVNFKSKGNGIFKVHEFNMLAPNKIDATLELKVQENVDRFCVDVVFYYWKIAPTAFELSISQEERILQIFSQPTENATLYRWVTRRFENSVLNLKGKWTVRLTAKIQEIFLGGIKFCAGGESIVRPKGRNMKSCNLLAKRNPENEQTTKKKLEEVINDSSLCKTLGGPCSEFSACAENSGCVFSRNKNPVRVTTKGWMLMLLPPPKESAKTRKTTTETPEVITLEPATTTAGAETTETTKTIPYFTHSLSLNIVKFIFTMVLFSWLLLQMKRLGKMAQGIESERSASPANDEIKTFTQERGEEFNLTSPRDLEP